MKGIVVRQGDTARQISCRLYAECFNVNYFGETT